MSEDNRDRYGRRHRQDDEYGLGESMPGTTGDSEGTFHDRASSDNNVIIGGRARNYEDHKRKQATQSETTQESRPSRDDNQSKPTGQFAELDGAVVEVEVERISGAGNPIATYRGIHVHVPDGEPGESYDVELTAKSGHFVGQVQTRE